MGNRRAGVMWVGLLAKHGAIYFGLGFSALFLEKLIEQPKPDYGANVTWLSLSLQSSAFSGAMVASVAVVTILVNLLYLRLGKARYGRLDRAYYPRLRRLSRIRTHPPSAYALLGIGLLLFAYWTWCFYVNIVHRFYFTWHGLFWPPSAILITILVLWGAAWLAEAMTRPTRQVLAVCYVYWACLLLTWLSVGCGYTIE